MLNKRYIFSKHNFWLSLFGLIVINLLILLRAVRIFLAFFVFRSIATLGLTSILENTNAIIYISLFVISFILEPILVTIHNLVIRILISKANYQFKLDVYDSFYSLKTSSLKSIEKEQLLNTITNDFSQYISSLIFYTLHFTASVVFVISSIVFVGLINWILLVSFLGVSIIYLLISFLAKIQKNKIDIKKSKINENFLTTINKKFSNFILYVNNGYKIPFISGALEIIGFRNKLYNTQENNKVLIGLPALIINASSILIIFGILWAAFNGAPNPAEIAIIAIGLSEFNNFKGSFEILTDSLGSRNNYLQFKNKITDFYKTFEGNKSIEYGKPISSISLENVSFSVEEKEIIKNLSLTINKGDKLLISGRSGSGKSTIISMLFNEIQPTSGKFLLNNSIIKDNISVSNNISFAYNENFLIDGTLNENIAFKNKSEKVDNQKIELIKKQLSIEYIEDEAANINSLDLSEGQKQKIVLARALYNEKDLFIFDEATSNLDKESLLAFEEILSKIEKTVIFISHTKLENVGKLFNKKLIFNDETSNWLLL